MDSLDPFRAGLVGTLNEVIFVASRIWKLSALNVHPKLGTGGDKVEDGACVERALDRGIAWEYIAATHGGLRASKYRGINFPEVAR